MLAEYNKVFHKINQTISIYEFMIANIEYRNSYLNLALNTLILQQTKYMIIVIMIIQNVLSKDIQQAQTNLCPILVDGIVSRVILLHLPFYECKRQNVRRFCHWRNLVESVQEEKRRHRETLSERAAV